MKSLFVAFLILVSISCTQENLSPNTQQSPEIKIPNEIYVAGFVATPIPAGFKFTAAYWKNGVKHELPGGTVEAIANTITVSRDNIWVVGTIADSFSANNLFIRKPAIWQNGLLSVLPLPQNAENIDDSWVHSIAINNSDVYTCGVIHTSNPNGTTSQTAVLWKNFELIPLQNAANQSANSIFISGETIYIAGNTGYWKDGVFKEVINAALLKSIKVFNGDVYVAGSFLNSQSKLVAGYAKNDMPFNTLSSTGPDNTDEVVSLDVSEGGITILGRFQNNVPFSSSTVLWKDSSINYIIPGKTDPFSLTLYQKQPVVAGISFTGDSQYTGCYWIEDKSFPMPDCAVANSIFVR